MFLSISNFYISIQHSWHGNRGHNRHASGQDGGIGRYIVPPCTTKRRTTTNLKTKNNQNCQRTELYGSPTTKELKEKHSSRLVWGAERGGWGGEDAQQGGGWRTGWSHICVQIKGRYNWRARQTLQPRVQAWGSKVSKRLVVKTCGGVVAVGKIPSLTGDFIGEIHRVLECIQTHPPRNQHQKGPICLWDVGEVTESHPRAGKAALFPFRALPHIYHHNAATWVAPPWQMPKALPPRT